MIAFNKTHAHHAVIIAVMLMTVTASMSRRMVICDESRDMGKPPRCGKKVIDKTGFVLRQAIKTEIFCKSLKLQ